MTEAASSPVRGVFWMFVTGLCFIAVTALVKYLGTDIPAAEAAFLRYLLGFVFMAPMLSAMWRAPPSRRLLRLFAMRGVFHTFGVILWFFGMSRLPIAEVTALNYLAPVYVSIGAVFVLGETFAVRRMAAVGVALLGAIVILRPGLREIEPGHLAMVLAAVVFAGSYLTAKVLADEAPATVVVGWLAITVTLGLAPFALADWVTPGLRDLGILLAVAFFATAGHYTMTLALGAAPVTVTQPVTFLQLVWAVLLGTVVFGEPIDIWVVLGGALIILSASFITWREAVLRRRSITPPVPATKL